MSSLPPDGQRAIAGSSRCPRSAASHCSGQPREKGRDHPEASRRRDVPHGEQMRRSNTKLKKNIFNRYDLMFDYEDNFHFKITICLFKDF